MLNRFNQFGLALALVSFAGFGVAHAQDEDMGDDAADPCADGDGDPCADPCGDDMGGDPCGDGGDEGGDEGGDTGGDAAAADGAAAAHGMTTPKGKIHINAAIGVNLSADVVADPIVISPDVVYGVMDKLDVGLYHTNYGLTGFWGEGAGPSGLCLVGDLCADVYNGPTGVLAQYELVSGQLSAAADGGLVLSNIAGDTMFMSLKLGADVRYALNEKMIIVTNPALSVGINERDFNKEALALPIAFMYGVNDKIHAGVQSGFSAPLEDFADFMAVQLNLAGMMKIDDKLSVGGALGFPNIAGNDGSSADFRSLNIFAMYNL